jgi:hypothetical protein
MTTHDVYKTDPQLLAGMADLENDASPLWSADELGAILRHQMSVAVRFDLGLGDDGKRWSPATRTDEAIGSFYELFHHPHPPIAWLVATKEFAKTLREHPRSPLPKEIATIVYLASILSARLRLGDRISSLDDEDLLAGVIWVLEQQWIDDATRSLFRDGLARIEESGPFV